MTIHRLCQALMIFYLLTIRRQSGDLTAAVCVYASGTPHTVTESVIGLQNNPDPFLHFQLAASS